MTDQGGTFVLFVNGTLMRGQPLHMNLEDAKFLGEARTAPRYRLYSIADRHPGMFEAPDSGISVHGELYEVSAQVWRRIAAGEPPNLYKGPVELQDGTTVDGILYPRELAQGQHRDISTFADWREYAKTLRKG
jgi:gamma-glutamylcyclotransferase (GGCT)/AIG2-like uncharacterized protein YtfP